MMLTVTLQNIDTHEKQLINVSDDEIELRKVINGLIVTGCCFLNRGQDITVWGYKPQKVVRTPV